MKLKRPALLIAASLTGVALLGTPAAQAADFAPEPGDYTINTTDLTFQGPATNLLGVDQNGVATFAFDNVNIPDGVNIVATGTRPVRITASGSLVFAGKLLGQGADATNFVSAANAGGPGGGKGGVDFTQPGQGTGGGRSPSTGNNGAGGGGFGGRGAVGGIDGDGTAGQAGPTYGDLNVQLQGGSGGGGASADSPVGGGGGGGGVALVARTTLTIPATGLIDVSGGDGAVGGFGASGGGSGGGIIVRGDSIDVTGQLIAKGGRGGLGGCCGDGGGGGGGRIAYQYRTLVSQGTALATGGESGVVDTTGCCFDDATLNTPEAVGFAGAVTLTPAPAVETTAATAVTETTATLNGSVNPNGNATSYHFEYGPTTEYGGRVPLAADPAIGSDNVVHGVSQAAIGLVPATTYHYRLVATNALGFETAGPDLTFTTATPPVSDADKDGVPVPQDCNDTNPGIHPGAKDVPGNGVDEDCANGDAIVVLGIGFTNKWTVFGTYTTVFKLEAKRVPKGGKVTVSCKGKGCPIKKKTITAKKAGTVKLTSLFKKKKGKKKVAAQLKPKAKVTIQVTSKDAIGNWFEATIQKGTKFPKTKQGCLAVNSKTKTTCPKG